MENFNSNFSPGEEIFELVRRYSEQEAERNRVKNKAKEESVKDLAIIKIGSKHCQKGEPPTCIVCVDKIEVGMEGMFMPCGHIYHPDCLKPWLESNNTCPVCRFELPKQN